MPPYNDPAIQPVIEMVRQASALSREIRDGMVVSAIGKEDRSPVTVADFAVQAVIARSLQQHQPGVALVAEESGAWLRTPEAAAVLETVASWVRRRVADATTARIVEWIDRGTAEPAERFWTLDPIDGTKGFLRGNHYAIALALIERGQVTASVIGCPMLDPAHPERPNAIGMIAVAAKGRGAWACTFGDQASVWRPLRVSPKTDIARAVLLESFESQHTNQSQTATTMQALGIAHPPIRMDSLGKFVVLAAGTGDILCRVPPSANAAYRENIWDQAAGALLVAEAGGTVTDLDGKPLDFSKGKKLSDNRGVLSTNGALHQRFLDALRRAG